ncbi:MAG: lytic transglycosylase domain-containing protein [Burkholderiales bacterium]|nr:lytic transglycosylase domain-containing protein [Burkholderiales bacterium]
MNKNRLNNSHTALRYLKLAVGAITAFVLSSSAFSASKAAANESVSAITAVHYVPATPSTVPVSWRLWESVADEIIGVVAATTKQKTNAADIYYESTRAGLEANAIFALVELLSRFDEMVVSTSGNVGLLQLSPILHSRLGNPVNTPYQGKYNLRLGCSVFRSYLDQEKGNLDRATLRFFRDASPQADPNARLGDFLQLYRARSLKLKETLPRSP